jgi:ubiquinone/menaquinone biosynthesis C-methylase UbiE
MPDATDPPKYFLEVYGTLPQAGPGDNVSTAQAYRLVTKLPDKPNILDIGCGPGRQTLELALLSRGRITALDNHQLFLDKVDSDAKQSGLAQYIKTTNQDMNHMGFPAESFDLIWSEGALYHMGFETALQKCRELLKKNGVLAATELVWLTDTPSLLAKEWAKDYAGIKTIAANLGLFGRNGYELIGHFTLPVSSWFTGYYDPMQVRINELKEKYQGNKLALETIASAQFEIDSFRKCAQEVGYEFFVARKTIRRKL